MTLEVYTPKFIVIAAFTYVLLVANCYRKLVKCAVVVTCKITRRTAPDRDPNPSFVGPLIYEGMLISYHMGYISVDFGIDCSVHYISRTRTDR